MSPLVSVMVPTYNQEQFVADSIQSCLDQTWPTMEIMVGDDASTDNTWDVISRLAEKNPECIRAVRNPQNLGVSANCNLLLARMTGKYVAFLAGDDLMYPGKISRQVSFLESHPNVAICAHDLDIVSENSSQVLGRWFDSAVARSGGVEVFLEHLCFVGGCSLMVRRDCLPAGLYHESLIASDWQFFVEVLLQHPGKEIRTLDEVLGAYRRHSGQLTSRTPRGLSNTLDHAFSCGWLDAKHPGYSSQIAACQRKWKDVLCNEMTNHAVWDMGVSEAQLNSPRWLLRRLFQVLRKRLSRHP